MMTKNETKELLKTIKGYYNSQFFIEECVVNAWYETMQPYDLNDAIEHIKDYVRENPDIAPKPQTFIRGLRTHEEKEALRKTEYSVECNLCHKFMPLEEYERHYDHCLDIQYLSNVAKQKGESYTRTDLENCTQAVLDKLLMKYPPNEVQRNG